MFETNKKIRDPKPRNTKYKKNLNGNFRAKNIITELKTQWIVSGAEWRKQRKKGIKDYRTIGINLYNNSDKTH